jgi:hypothetical protein
MCQLGAVAMSRRGQTYKEILAHYYAGARLGRLLGTPPSRPGAQDGIGTSLPSVTGAAGLALREADRVSAMAPVAAPAEPRG